MQFANVHPRCCSLVTDLTGASLFLAGKLSSCSCHSVTIVHNKRQLFTCDQKQLIVHFWTLNRDCGEAQMEISDYRGSCTIPFPLSCCPSVPWPTPPLTLAPLVIVSVTICSSEYVQLMSIGEISIRFCNVLVVWSKMFLNILTHTIITPLIFHDHEQPLQMSTNISIFFKVKKLIWPDSRGSQWTWLMKMRDYYTPTEAREVFMVSRN